MQNKNPAQSLEWQTSSSPQRDVGAATPKNKGAVLKMMLLGEGLFPTPGFDKHPSVCLVQRKKGRGPIWPSTVVEEHLHSWTSDQGPLFLFKYFPFLVPVFSRISVFSPFFCCFFVLFWILLLVKQQKKPYFCNLFFYFRCFLLLCLIFLYLLVQEHCTI